MIPVIQDKCCLQASIASLLEIELYKVPVVGEDNWIGEMRQWLNARGWTMYVVTAANDSPQPMEGYTIKCGYVGSCAIPHATVALNGETVHNPLSAEFYITDDDRIYHIILVPLNPAECFSEHSPADLEQALDAICSAYCEPCDEHAHRGRLMPDCEQCRSAADKLKKYYLNLIKARQR